MSSSVVNPTIFREYIGVKPYPDNLNDFPTQIINPRIQEFHFILGFANEDGNGNFHRAWNFDYFGADRVRQLKADYPKVKVVISIGGRGPKYPFNSHGANERWIENATNSVIGLIEDYNDLIDGIDINYEEVNATEIDFAHCIGKLITHVKEREPNIKVVSIAPSLRVAHHYSTLYQEYQGHIDWVDYQFYNDNVPAMDDFVNRFLDLQQVYGAHKLLPGYSTDLNDAHGVMPEEVFIEGCRELVNRKLLAGVFIWNAHDSAVPKSNDKPFTIEGTMQKILTNVTMSSKSGGSDPILAPSHAEVIYPTIFREYIGVKDYPDTLNDFPARIINSNIPEFHFILGFATENKDRRDGNFNLDWNRRYFSAEHVKQLKDKHPKVKVVISIGGRGSEHRFNPDVATDNWIKNAKNSVKTLIKDYGGHDIIDGIDINYEEVESNQFPDCIGKLIKDVKLARKHNVVSIAPSRPASSHYKKLYERYPIHIDWVDYYYYNQIVSSTEEFIDHFHNLQRLDYDAHKLLAGYSTDPEDAHHEMTQDVFIEGCKKLVKKKLIAGVSLWNANDSADPDNPNNIDGPFYLEKRMQQILTDTDTIEIH